MNTVRRDVMEDATFILPVRIESMDRLSNLLTVVHFLRRHYPSRIIVGSEDATPFRAALPADVDVVALAGQAGLPFHHARALNDLARHVTTPVTVKMEADVIIPPAQMREAVRMTSSGAYDLVRPYRVAYTIDRHERLQFAQGDEHMSFAEEPRRLPFTPLGYCAVWNTAAHRRGGMENEHFISWGLEDDERLARAAQLGMVVSQTDGGVFHLHHDRLTDSLHTNVHYSSNACELRRVQSLSADALRAEIADWPWVHGTTSTPVTPVQADDLTILVPVRVEQPSRRDNLVACVRAARAATTARIVVGTGAPDALADLLPHGVEVVAMHDPPGAFHHTRLNNELARLVDTPLLANLDADIVVPAAQWQAAVDRLRAGADLVLPYAAVVHGVPSSSYPWLVRGDFASVPPTERRIMHPNGPGGCVLWRRTGLLAAGMDNEHLVSWGHEDHERLARARTLGLRVERCDGDLYHIDHDRTPQSDARNPSYAANKAELERIRAMSAEELRAEIATWPWREVGAP